MATVLGIDGFEPCKRLILYAALSCTDLAIAAINALFMDVSYMAYQFRLGSAVQGLFGDSLPIDTEGDVLIAAGVRVQIFHERNLTSVPWAECGIRHVLTSSSCTPNGQIVGQIEIPAALPGGGGPPVILFNLMADPVPQGPMANMEVTDYEDAPFAGDSVSTSLTHAFLRAEAAAMTLQRSKAWSVPPPPMPCCGNGEATGASRVLRPTAGRISVDAFRPKCVCCRLAGFRDDARGNEKG